MLMNPYCYFETQLVTCFFLGEMLAKKDVLMGVTRKAKVHIFGWTSITNSPHGVGLGAFTGLTLYWNDSPRTINSSPTL